MLAQDLWQWWWAQDRINGLPPKSAVSPFALKTLLPHLVLYERRSPTDFNIRLMGTDVVARIGMEGTGRNVLDLMAGASRDHAKAALDRVLDTPAVHLSMVEDVYSSGRSSLVLVFRAPMADGDGRARFILSVTEEVLPVAYREQSEGPNLLAKPVRSRFFPAHERIDWVDVTEEFAIPAADGTAPSS